MFEFFVITIIILICALIYLLEKRHENLFESTAKFQEDMFKWMKEQEDINIEVAKFFKAFSELGKPK